MSQDEQERPTSSEQQRNQVLDDVREKLADGFSFVRGAEISTALSALSFEEVIARHIKSIEEDDSDIRPSRIHAIERIKEDVRSALEQVRQLPDNSFTDPVDTATNTREDGSGPGTEEV